MAYEQQVLLLQVSLVYIVSYYILKLIDAKMVNDYQNLISRISLCIACISIIFNLYPTHEFLDFNAVGYGSLVFFGSLGIWHLIVHSDRTSRSKKTVFQFLCYFLWTQCPVSKVKDTKLHLKLSVYNIMSAVLLDLIPCFVFCYIVFVSGGYLVVNVDKCLNDETKVNMIENNYLYLMYYTVLFTTYILLLLLNMSVGFRAITRCLTLNRYNWSHYNNYPLISTSVKELWSKRYNRLPRSILHEQVFTPLRKSGFSNAFAALMAFVVSGLLHVYIQWKHCNYGLFSTFCFFLIHAMITIIESNIYAKKKRKDMSMMEVALRICFTNAIFVVTLPLYMGLIIHQHPLYGVMTDEIYHDTLESQYVKMLMPYVPSLQFICIYPQY